MMMRRFHPAKRRPQRAPLFPPNIHRISRGMPMSAVTARGQNSRSEFVRDADSQACRALSSGEARDRIGRQVVARRLLIVELGESAPQFGALRQAVTIANGELLRPGRRARLADAADAGCRIAL